MSRLFVADERMTSAPPCGRASPGRSRRLLVRHALLEHGALPWLGRLLLALQGNSKNAGAGNRFLAAEDRPAPRLGPVAESAQHPAAAVPARWRRGTLPGCQI